MMKIINNSYSKNLHSRSLTLTKISKRSSSNTPSFVTERSKGSLKMVAADINLKIVDESSVNNIPNTISQKE